MIFQNVWALARKSFSFTRTATISPLLSVAMASGASLLLLSLVIGVRRVGVGGLLSTLPITRLVVGPKQVDLLFLRLGSSTVSMESSAIDSLRNIDGVAAVWPEMVLTMPTSLTGNLIGTPFSTDCATYGVPLEFFPPEQRPSGFSRAKTGEPIPAVLSLQLIDLYNSGFAGAQNLPGLSPKALLGRHFNLFLGTSSFFPSPPGGKTKWVRCKIVGLSDLVSVTGVTVPETYAKEWHEWYYDGAESPKFSSLHVVVESSEQVATVRKEIEALGLQARSPGEMAEKVALVSRYLSFATAVLMGLLLLLAGMGTANTLGLEVTFQAQRIGLYRALGASRKDVTRIYLLRAVWIGVSGAIAGLIPAAVLLLIADSLLVRVLPALARLPSSPLAISPFLMLISCVLAITASVVAGLGPAVKASRVDPVVALRRQET